MKPRRLSLRLAPRSEAPGCKVLQLAEPESVTHAAAVTSAVLYYDRQRELCTERGARIQAEWYLRRKVEGMDANMAAVLLADALAVRASARLENFF